MTIYLFQISKENLMKIVEKLMVHIGKANCTICRDKLIVIIVDVCSQDNYHFITCFQWYNLLFYINCKTLI